MSKPPVPLNEKGRVKALHNYNILDTADEHEFDRITELASIICDVPISLVSLIDEDRQWFKSNTGLNIKETPREQAFCGYTILDHDFFVVEDATKDDRFKNNELVTGDPDIRFYAGYPLVDPAGFALGSLCVIDQKPKALTVQQKRALQLLGQEVTALIVDRRLREELRSFEKVFNMSNDLVFVGGLDGYFKKVNPAFTKLLGWTEEQLLSTRSFEFYHPDDVKKTENELEHLTDGVDTVNFLQRFKTSSEKYKTIQWTSTPETTSGFVYGIGRDVTEIKLNEHKLEVSEEKLRLFFENSLGIMITHDMKGKFLSINKEGAAILGYTAAEILKMNLFDVVPEPQHEAVTAYLADIKETGSAKGRMSTRHKDGSIRIWMYNNILEKSAGKPFVIVNGMDITDQHRLQKELKKTSQMLEQTNQVARVGGWEYDVAKQQIFWSSVTKEIHGVPRDYVPDLSTAVTYYKEGKSREKITEVLNLAFTEGIPWDEELQIINAQGEDIWVRALGNAEFEDGVCKRLYGTFQDIDDFKLGELALKRSIETQEKLNDVMFQHIELIEQQDKTIEKIQEFKFLADSIPQIVWTSNPDGSVDYYNKHWFDYTGLTLDETIEHQWLPVLHPDDVERDTKIWEECMRTGKPYESEIRFKRANDGMYKWHLGRAVAMKDERGKITKWFGSCTDIDVYKKALDLENKITQFEDFNRIVAHNLRGPAGSIAMMLDIVAESEDEDEKKSMIPLLKESSATLINSLNELMKVLEVRNNQNLPYDDCDLQKMTHTVENMLIGQVMAKKAIITTDFKLTSMKFPKMYLESIFYNMISNSLKYTKADIPPEIHITSENVKGKIVLTFSDNGLGIDLQRHSKAMFKLNATFHRGFDSKGVGLFMTKTQIETFGGHISVESEPNVGTTFTVAF